MILPFRFQNKCSLTVPNFSLKLTKNSFSLSWNGIRFFFIKYSFLREIFFCNFVLAWQIAGDGGGTNSNF